MKIIRSIPLFAILLIFYNAVIAFFRMTTPELDILNYRLFEVTLPSQKPWAPTSKDALILLGLMVLYIEIIKSTSSSDQAIVEHVFSMFVFLVYLIEFLLFPYVADSTFLILCFMSLIDVIAGFTISISAARRDLSVSG